MRLWWLGLIWAHNLLVRWAKDFLLWVVLGTKTQQTCFSISPSLSLLLSLVFSSSPSSQFLLPFFQPPFLPLAYHIYNQELVGSYAYSCG